jgi:hypothetical protein
MLLNFELECHNIQCVSFELEPGAETVEGREGEVTGLAFRKRRGDGMTWSVEEM